MAKRVIDGPLFKESWVELDLEVRNVEEKLAKRRRQDSEVEGGEEVAIIAQEEKEGDA